MNIENATRDNTDYRRVISTSPQMQLVVMCILPGEEIGMEKHVNTTQFIRVESGHGLTIVEEVKNKPLVMRHFGPGDAIFVMPGHFHNVINDGNEDLKLYTLYAPPTHPIGLVEHYKKD